MQKKLYDISWSDESECQACHKEEGTERHRLYHYPKWHADQKGYPRGLQKVAARSQNLKERVELAKRYCYAPSQ